MTRCTHGRCTGSLFTRVSERGAKYRGFGSHTENPWLGRVEVNALDSLFETSVSMGDVKHLVPRTGALDDIPRSEQRAGAVHEGSC